MSDRLRGIIPALTTPFDPGDGAVDVGALDAHLDWLYASGVRCASVLGTTGEGPALGLSERMDVIERLSAHPTGMALVPGTGATSLPETIELSRFAIDRGVEAVLVAPPSYYEPERNGLVGYYSALLEALPDVARVVLYHIPAYTGVNIEPELARALRSAYGERVAGVKDSGGRPEHSQALRAAVPELILLSGNDGAIADSFRAGMHGVISAMAAVVPTLVLATERAVAAGHSGAEQQQQVSAVRDLTRALPQRAALKALLTVTAGLPDAAVRPPLAELTGDERAALLVALGSVLGSGEAA